MLLVHAGDNAKPRIGNICIVGTFIISLPTIPFVPDFLYDGSIMRVVRRHADGSMICKPRKVTNQVTDSQENEDRSISIRHLVFTSGMARLPRPSTA